MLLQYTKKRHLVMPPKFPAIGGESCTNLPRYRPSLFDSRARALRRALRLVSKSVDVFCLHPLNDYGSMPHRFVSKPLLMPNTLWIAEVDFFDAEITQGLVSLTVLGYPEEQINVVGVHHARSRDADVYALLGSKGKVVFMADSMLFTRLPEMTYRNSRPWNPCFRSAVVAGLYRDMA